MTLKIINAIYLYPCKVDSNHCISIGNDGGYLRSPAGNMVSSESEQVIEDVIFELQSYGDIEITENGSLIGLPITTITPYALLSTKLDFWEGEKLLEHGEIELMRYFLNDPLTKISPGPEKVDQLHQWRKVITILENKGYDFYKLQYYANDQTEIMGLSFAICEDFNSTRSAVKSVFINILNLFGSPILSWAFCFHDLSEEAFAIALTETADFQMSLDFEVEEELENIEDKEGSIESPDFEDDVIQQVRNLKRKEKIDAIVKTLDVCRKFMRKLSESSELKSRVESGENAKTEFKQTFSLDIKSRTKEKYIVESCIKTIAGFLNSEGGELLIGVGDNGEVFGIEEEVELFYKNNDKFLLHFKDKVRSAIGENFFTLIKYEIRNMEGNEILRVICDKSDNPVFVDKTIFYVRVNPATEKIEGTDLLNYVQAHFPIK